MPIRSADLQAINCVEQLAFQNMVLTRGTLRAILAQLEQVGGPLHGEYIATIHGCAMY